MIILTIFLRKNVKIFYIKQIENLYGDEGIK